MQNYDWWKSIMNNDWWKNTHNEVMKLMIKKYKKINKLSKDEAKLEKFKGVLYSDMKRIIETNCQFDYYHEIISSFCKLFEMFKKFSRLLMGLFTFLDKQLEVEEKR